jgi:hypothetical protein
MTACRPFDSRLPAFHRFQISGPSAPSVARDVRFASTSTATAPRQRVTTFTASAAAVINGSRAVAKERPGRKRLLELGVLLGEAPALAAHELAFSVAVDMLTSGARRWGLGPKKAAPPSLEDDAADGKNLDGYRIRGM